MWGLTILLDVIAAIIGGNVEGWNIYPEHFSERHGLFVIIALGETLIVAGSGVTGEAWTGNLIGIAILGVAITCGLWWSYFPKLKPALEHAMTLVQGGARARFARDVFSLLHFVVLCGVIAYAFAIEEAVAHPDDPLPFIGRLALALGFALFVGGMALAMWRATARFLVARVVLTLVTVAAIIFVAGVSPLITLAIAFVGIVLIDALEQQIITVHQ